MFTLDTNAIIYYINADASACEILDPIFESDDAIYISTITELELFSFSDLSIDEEFKINRLLQTVAILPLSSRIARTAGHLRSIHRMGVADSAIAATALFTGSVLLTRNTRDFKRVTTLRTQLV